MTTTDTNATTSDLVEIPIGQLDAHPHNIRRSLGSLDDLVRSIRTLGVLEPLIVMPADHNGRHVIVAGHRRLAAATKADLATVPCVVRSMNEADVLEAMLAENGDGIRARITLVEEAEAYARLMTLRDGLTVKSLASRVGRSQSYVRSRLVVLALPSKALDRLHRGDFTLDVATALAKAADDPALIDQLLDSDRLDEWTIERAVKARATERQRSDREADVVAAGHRLLATDGTKTAQRLDALLTERADRRRHAKEPCHAVAVQSGWGGPVVVEYCTDPRRHRASTPAEQRSPITATPTRATDTTDDERRKADSTAKAARRQFLADKVANGGLAQAATARFAFQALVATVNQQRATVVARTLRLNTTSDGGTTGAGAALADHAMASARQLATVAALIAAAEADEHAGPYRPSYSDDPLLVAYYRWLTDLGYQPTDQERQLLDTPTD